MKVPIYLTAPQGKATYSNFYVDEVNMELGTGQVIQKDGSKNPLIADQASLKKAGYLVYTQPELKKVVAGYQKFKEQQEQTAAVKNAAINPNSNNNNNMEHNYQKASIVTTQTPEGKLGAQRLERPSLKQGLVTYTLELDNTAGAAPVTLVVGDGMGLIATELGLPPLPAAFVVGGTWGADSLSTLANFAENMPLVLKVMQTRTSDPAGAIYFSGDFMKDIAIDIVKSVTTTPINFAIGQDGTQFNEAIRRIGGFRKLLSQLNGLLTTIPAGEKVTINFYVESYDSGTIQGKV